MIDLHGAEIAGRDTEMKVERVDYDTAVSMAFIVKDHAGEPEFIDAVTLTKVQAKQLRIFLQALE